ncbi:hypothetical protein RJ640_007446 [Escallonia rubra]|uniref:Uncharacterized protein n=1 Tax=Escallonia rubra TaxID=112253 RepID=A0AA88UEU2_9ASTE|nr:hypothetical protein RJ640_007446 [Escallonia rubra]
MADGKCGDGQRQQRQGTEALTAGAIHIEVNKKKDSNALVIIQQAVHDSVFSRIATSTTSKQAWSILQKEFQGDSKIIVAIEEEDSVVVVTEEGEVDLVGNKGNLVSKGKLVNKGSPLSKQTTRMAFNAIIARDMVIQELIVGSKINK